MPHLQALKVLQHNISDALIISFYVSIGASFPEININRFLSLSITEQLQ